MPVLYYMSDLFKMVCQKGAQLEALDKAGNTPLAIAVNKGHER